MERVLVLREQFVQRRRLEAVAVIRAQTRIPTGYLPRSRELHRSVSPELAVVVEAHSAGQCQLVEQRALPLRIIAVDALVAGGRARIEFQALRGNRGALRLGPEDELVRLVDLERTLIFESRGVALGEEVLRRRERIGEKVEFAEILA